MSLRAPAHRCTAGGVFYIFALSRFAIHTFIYKRTLSHCERGCALHLYLLHLVSFVSARLHIEIHRFPNVTTEHLRERERLQSKALCGEVFHQRGRAQLELMPVSVRRMDGNSNELQSIKWSVKPLYFFQVKIVDKNGKDLVFAVFEYI